MTLQTARSAAEQLLDDNLILRPVTLDDLQAALTLFNLCAMEELGVTTMTESDLLNEWRTPNWDLESSTRAIFTPEGQMVAYCDVFDARDIPVRPAMWGRVHPDYRGRGLGTLLTTWGEERAREAIARCPADARVVLMSWMNDVDKTGRALMEGQGFFNERGSYQMLIEMTEAPPAPQWPEGITMTTLAEFGDARTVFAAHREAFSDHRGFVPGEDFDTSFERWSHYVLNSEHHDPTVWFLAMDGNEIAGYSLCEPKAWDDPDKAFVDMLGVRPAYRRHGLGLALLHHTFGEFWKRGIKKVGLGVDATSITNAVALYERAGMHVFRRFHTYEKELRPGIEYSKQ